MYTIFGITYYTHGFGLVFVFPFVIWFFIAVEKATLNYFSKKEQVKLGSVALSASISLMVFAGVFLDVFLIGHKASRLCNNKAGMNIYKKVEAEGLVGLYSIKNLSDFGLKYVEYENSKGEKYLVYMENNKEMKKEIDRFKSNIEFVMEDKKISSRVIISSKKLVNRINDEVYSDLIYIVVYPGWADSIFINLTGTQYSGWSCGEIVNTNSGEVITFMDLIEATIVH